MKKYHVCAVGSALVDFEFEVSQAQFNALNIQKGVMTLVDDDTVDWKMYAPADGDTVIMKIVYKRVVK